MKGYQISGPALTRIGEVVRYVEQIRRTPPPTTKTVSETSAVTIKVTTATGRMSGATPDTTGRGIIQDLVSGSYVNAVPATAYPLLNDTTSVFAVGAYVKCVPSYGYWAIINVDSCAHLS